MSRPDFEDLIERLLDDDLDAAGLAALERLCQGDQASATELVLRLQQEADLRGLLRRLDLAEAVHRRLQEARVRDGVMQQINSASPPPWPRRGRNRRQRSRQGRHRTGRGRRLTSAVVGTTVLGCALLIGLLLWPEADPTGPSITGPATMAGLDLPAGTHPLAWNSSIEADSAVILPGDGSRLELAGRLQSPSRSGSGDWFLEHGRLLCQVSPRSPATPFLVHTPHGSVHVLGTRFEVTVAEQASQVRVLSGRVRISDGQDERILQAGQQDQLGGQTDDWTLYLIDPDQPTRRRRIRSGDQVSVGTFGTTAINLEVVPPAGVEALGFTVENEDPDLPTGQREPRSLEQFPPFMVYGNHRQTGEPYRTRPPMGPIRLQAEAYADDAGERPIGSRTWTFVFTP